jgi:tetratricopeptide (TPR) repeat protein
MVIVFLVLPSLALSQEVTDKFALKSSNPYEIEGWKAWAKGNDREAISNWTKLIDSSNKRMALSYWYLIGDIIDENGFHKEAIPLIDDISKGDIKNPYLNSSLEWEKVQNLISLGEYDLARKSLSKLGVITDWLVIGPFDNVGRSGFYKVFTPEEEVNLEKVYTGKMGMEVKWFPSGATFGVMKFDTLLYPSTEGVAYALNYLYSPSDREVYIRLGSSGATSIWLNDTRVLSRDVYRNLYIDQDIVRCQLNKGWNKLLIKVCQDTGIWGFILRITDTDGNAIPELKYSLEPKEFTKGTNYEILEEPLPEDYWNLIYAGIIYRKQGIWDKAEKCFLKAIEISDTALPHYFLGITYLDNEKSDEGITELKKAHSLAEEFSKAYVELGWNRYSKGLYDEAIDYFQMALDYNPNYAQAYAYMAWTYLQRGWLKDAELNMKDALNINNSYTLGYYLDGVIAERRGWYEDAISSYKKVLDINKNFSTAFTSLVSLYKSMGRYEEAISIIQDKLAREPYNISLYLDLTNLYISSKKTKDALPILEKASSLSPYHPEVYYFLGDLYYEFGEKERALSYWEKALEIEPGNITLKDYISFLKKETYSLTDVSKLITNTPTQKDYPDASSIIIFDNAERVVHPDGTSSLTYHRVIKILNERGRENYGEVFIPYSLLSERVKILKARTIKPDGTEVEATAINDVSLAEGYHLYSDAMAKVISMPALENNAIIEYAYTIDELGRGAMGKNFQDEFYFQDFDPIMNARYTVTVPKDMEIYYKMSNGDLTPKISEQGTTRTYIWEMNNVPQIIPEDYMPPLGDIVPRLEITTFKSWDEVAGWYYDIANPKTQADDAIKAKVIELTKDKSTLEEKVRAIYSFVTNDIRYVGLEFGIGGLMPHQASEVFKYKYGDCKDKATLLISMFKEINIPAYYVLVRTRDRGSLPVDSPGFQFDHAICAIRLNDKLYFLDGTAEDNRFGYIPSMDQGTKALLIEDGRPILVDIPVDDVSINEKTRDVNVTLTKDGSVKGNATVKLKGFYDTYLRGQWKSASDREIREALEWSLRSLVPNATLDTYELSDLRNLDTDVWEKYSFHASGYAQVAGNTISFLPSIMERLESSESVAKATRIYPITYWSPYTTRDTVTYTLPDGLSIIHLPSDLIIEKPFGFYSMTFKVEGNILKVERVFQIRNIYISPEAYKEYKDFIEKIVSKDRERVVLSF